MSQPNSPETNLSAYDKYSGSYTAVRYSQDPSTQRTEIKPAGIFMPVSVDAGETVVGIDRSEFSSDLAEEFRSSGVKKRYPRKREMNAYSGEPGWEETNDGSPVSVQENAHATTEWAPPTPNTMPTPNQPEPEHNTEHHGHEEHGAYSRHDGHEHKRKMPFKKTILSIVGGISLLYGLSALVSSDEGSSTDHTPVLYDDQPEAVSNGGNGEFLWDLADRGVQSENPEDIKAAIGRGIAAYNQAHGTNVVVVYSGNSADVYANGALITDPNDISEIEAAVASALNP